MRRIPARLPKVTEVLSQKIPAPWLPVIVFGELNEESSAADRCKSRIPSPLLLLIVLPSRKRVPVASARIPGPRLFVISTPGPPATEGWAESDALCATIIPEPRYQGSPV